MKKGILYVAIGELWIQEAILASRIVKKYMPSLPITIFADRAFNCEHVDQVVVAETGASPILTKTQWLARSPYEHTLALDTDITLCDSIADLFMLLERFHLAVPQAPYRLENMGLPSPLPDFLADGVPDCFPGMNTGMLLYRRVPEVQDLFAEWCQHHELLNALIPGAPQQPGFRTALYRSKLHFSIIPDEYHCRFVFPFKVCGKVKALHGRHPDMNSVIKRINNVALPRVGAGYFVEVGNAQREGMPTMDEAPDLPAGGIPNGGVISLL